MEQKGAFALKLDLIEVYDKVEWGFLKEVMLKMGFHERWVDFALRCVQSVSYKICMNGENAGEF